MGSSAAHAGPVHSDGGGPMALIMAGGGGESPWPWTDVLPKPLLPVRGRAVIDWTLAALERGGFGRVVVSLCHMAPLLRAYLTTGRGREAAWGREALQLAIVKERKPLGTAGALRLVRNPSDPLLVVSGDVLTTAPLAPLYHAHETSQAVATIATRRVCHSLSHTEVVLDGERVIDMVANQRHESRVCAGIYVFSADSLAMLPPKGPVDMTAFVVQLLKRGLYVRAVTLPGYWAQLDTAAAYERACREFPGWPKAKWPREGRNDRHRRNDG